MTEYFNVLKNGDHVFDFASHGLILVAIGIGLILFFKIKGAPKHVLIFVYLWTGLGVLWTSSVYYLSVRDYQYFSRAILNKKYQEVEGYVENFQSFDIYINKARYVSESFSVKGVNFHYASNVETTGFNQTKSYGGPIDEGKYVRIRYYEDLILQLWVKD